jgi:hypothetical protein
VQSSDPQNATIFSTATFSTTTLAKGWYQGAPSGAPSPRTEGAFRGCVFSEDNPKQNRIPCINIKLHHNISPQNQKSQRHAQILRAKTLRACASPC